MHPENPSLLLLESAQLAAPTHWTSPAPLTFTGHTGCEMFYFEGALPAEASHSTHQNPGAVRQLEACSQIDPEKAPGA